MLKGKAGIVTGSTRGIGLAIARQLAGAGSHVMLNGFGDREEIEKIRTDMERDFGVRVLYSDADMTRKEDIDELVKWAFDEFGKVDILVNNAGVQHVAPVEEFPEEKWELIISLNLTAAFRAIKAVIPSMKSNGWGRIINIASAHGLVASPYKTAYVASKHGLVGLTKVIALEIAESNITCNAICPGYVRTPLVDGQIKDQAKSRGISEEEVIRDVILDSQPNKEFVKAEDIGKLAVYLTGDAAGAINGASLPIDGGWTAE